MPDDMTIPQGGPERRESKERSLRQARPPTQVPGYEPERFLGMGAYGEVWVAIQRNTGRRVAIKFYAHRGGLDWSLLSREVEKLAFLFADRYVVQLIGVGWDAAPPYYIMEYLEHGSLADRLEGGPLPVHEAVALFHDVAVGLVHAHGKGVLHCDLKPANILLDQDGRPRLADFGQSRLSHEQAPALGTLFYMAPEQADLEAVPDARWDVYALGALLYCMITGGLPHRTPEAVRQLEQSGDLAQRLALYRRLIRRAPPPAGHRQVPGVDRDLAQIVDRCLAADPEKRFANVQAVLDALSARHARRARRPLMLFGAIGPVLLLLVVGVFAWQGFAAALRQSEDALVARALESNRFAAQYVARATGGEVARRYRAVERVLESEEFRAVYRETLAHPEIRDLLARLADPKLPPGEGARLIETFRGHAQRERLQKAFEAAIPPEMAVGKRVNSWFLNDALGTQLARVPEEADVVTIGRNYAWRSYFHGGPADVADKSWRPPPGERLKATQMSAAYRSEATNLWNVAVSTPVTDKRDGPLTGVVGLTVGVGDLVELHDKPHQFAVLVEEPLDEVPGHVLEHPLFAQFRGDGGKLPEEFNDLKVTVDALPNRPERKRRYEDPMARAPGGSYYAQRWLAEMEPVSVMRGPTGWLVIVQESYESAIGATMRDLRWELIRHAAAAAASMVLVVIGLWAFAMRLSRESRIGALPGAGSPPTERPGSSMTPSATPGRTPGRLTSPDALTEPMPAPEKQDVPAGGEGDR